MRYLFSCLKKVGVIVKLQLKLFDAVCLHIPNRKRFKSPETKQVWPKKRMKKDGNAHNLEIFHSIFTTELDLFWNRCKQDGRASANIVQLLQECNVFDDDLQNWKAAVMYQISFDDSFFTEYDRSVYFYIYFSRHTQAHIFAQHCFFHVLSCLEHESVGSCSEAKIENRWDFTEKKFIHAFFLLIHFYCCCIFEVSFKKISNEGSVCR